MGGGKRYVQNLINNYINKKIHVTVIGAQTNLKTDLQEKEYLSFIPIVHTDSEWVPFFLNLFIKLPQLSNEKNTIFHIHRTYFAVPFLFFKKKAPLVCTVHGLSLDEMKLRRPFLRKILMPIYQVIERYCLQRINYFIAVNQRTLDLYKERHPYKWLEKKSNILPAGVELELFHPMVRETLREKYNIPKDYKIVLFVGRLDKCKNIEFIIRTFKFVLQREPRSRLFIIGRGSEDEALIQLVQKLNINNFVRFWGEVKHDELPEIINCTNVLVISSHFETGPIVIKESLGCGVPIVTFDVGDVELWLKDNRLGRIVRSRVESEFADAIYEYFQKDISNFDISREAHAVLSKFSWETISAEYTFIYRKLLKDNS
jgi:glycosyltransferase involved in cell wall biosynthesis